MTKRLGLALLVASVVGVVGCSREDEGTPAVGMVEVASPEASSRAIAYMQEHREELKMRAPIEELATIRTVKDHLDMTHVRLHQVERGVRVIGGGGAVHYDAAGGITALHQKYVPDLERLDVKPTLDATKAKTFIREGEKVIGEPELVIFAFNHRTPKLAYEMTVQTIGHRDAWLLTIDAHTGEEIDRITRQHSIQGTGVGVFGKKRNIEYSNTNGQFALVDSSRAFNLSTFDARSSANTQQATILIGANANTWDTTSQLGPGSGVDAHANIGLVIDYYAKKFGRKSWDDKNGDVQIIVHVGDDQDGSPGLDNAFYDNVQNAMSFGDGKDLLKPTAGFLDVTAHELTHAVTHYSSDLRYEDQTGALNESMSDVMAAMIEHSIAPSDSNNWLIGEGSLLNPTAPALRDMTDPGRGLTPQPSHMTEFERTKEDAGGVHINSGIPNKAAQLMTMGGNHGISGITIPHGIGWDNAAKVWYRANTVYLTDTSDFADAAQATMKAAADLKLSQDDQNVIDCAWKAVGVVQGACAKINPPPPTTQSTPGSTTADNSTNRGDSDDDDDATESKPKKKKSKKIASAPAEQGCSMVAPGAGTSNGLWLVAVGAVVIRLRRRR